MTDDTKPDTARGLPLEAGGAMAFLVIAAAAIWAISSIASATIPDWIYRDAAETSSAILLWILLSFSAAIAVPAILSRAGYPATSKVVMTILCIATLWYMMATTMAVDLEGRSNPYVRAAEADARSYDDLARFSKDPRVAALIRAARRDGTITQGEAYDITHSPEYMAAWADSSRRETARAKQTVLNAG